MSQNHACYQTTSTSKHLEKELEMNNEMSFIDYSQFYSFSKNPDIFLFIENYYGDFSNMYF